MVVLAGSVPASALPSSIEKTGIARTMSTAAEMIAAGQGRRWIKRLHAAQNPVPGGLVLPSPGMRKRSTRRPILLSIAGSSVSDASIVSRTASEDATAGPYRNETPRANIPSSAITTVAPANSTARPEVSIALRTASRTSSPSRSPARKRVTMNRA